MVYPTASVEILEHMATHNFIYGVRDDTVKNALPLARYSNTREALGKALEIKAAYKAADANNLGQCEVRGAQIEEEDPLKAITKKLDTLLAKSNFNGCQTCYCCGKPGHVKKMCRVVLPAYSSWG